MKIFAFTCGDINGIGPEISIKTFNKIYSPNKNKLLFYIPANIFESTVKLVNPKFKYEIVKSVSDESLANKLVTVVDLGKAKLKKGIPTQVSGEVCLKSVRMAFEQVMLKNADAIITSPISKEALDKAGSGYPGHTEMLAEWCRVSNPTMMFYSTKMLCALVTIHEPIKNVPQLITKRNIYSKIKTVKEILINDFKIKKPRIALLGLNPHAGEAGRIGIEEKSVIEPVIKSFEDKNIQGPFVPDAFFGNKLFAKFDAVIGMYHDQVLIPFKMMSFNKGVNFTAGIPIIRTSPDHGTAFDIAWKNKANPDSLIESFKLAGKLIETRRQNK